MTDLTIGLMGIGAILLLMAARVPIAIALSGVSFLGIYTMLGERAALSFLRNAPYDFIAHWSLSAIPMFLLMGSIAFRAGLVASLYHAARQWLAWMPGGLAVASTFACAGFAAASGSSVATATAMGRIAVPEMLRYRYDKALATGVVASAGTLGSLIPPSILMILYGVFAEVSIGRLMIAAIIPGVLTALVYAAMIVVRVRLNPALAPPNDIQPTWAERWGSLRDVWPLPVLVIGVIGSLYTGVATATEAGALGAFLAMLIAMAMRRLTWRIFRDAVMDALRSTAVIFFIAIGAVLLSRFVVLSGIPAAMVGLVEVANFGTLGVILFCGAMFIVLGMFLDPVGLMLISLPIMLPMVGAAGFDLIWFGIIMIKFIEIGLITPPVGLSVYAIKSAVGNLVPLERIFAGVTWFIACDLMIIALLVMFPGISLYLTTFMA